MAQFATMARQKHVVVREKESDVMVTKLNRAGIDITSDYEYALDREICHKVFEQLILMWPEKLDVSKRLVAPNGKLYSPKLAEENDRVEVQYEAIVEQPNTIGSIDEWAVVGWAICKCLQPQTWERDIISPRELKFTDIEKSILADHLGWKGEEPEGVTENSVITVNEDTGEVLSVKNPD